MEFCYPVSGNPSVLPFSRSWSWCSLVRNSEVYGSRNKLGGWVSGWLFFLQIISQDWVGLRMLNLAQRWRLVWGWCMRLDFWKKFFNCEKLKFLACFCGFCKNTNFSTPLAQWRHVYTETAYTLCEWILNTLPQTVQSTEDPVTIATLLV